MSGTCSLLHMTAPINRRQFWIGLAVLFAVIKAMFQAAGSIYIDRWFFYALMITFIAGFLFLARKRLRDRARPVWLALPYLVVPPAIIRTGDLVSNGQGIPTLVCYIAAYGLLVWTSGPLSTSAF